MGRELVIYERTFSIPDPAEGKAIEKDPCGLSLSLSLSLSLCAFFPFRQFNPSFEVVS